MTKVHDYPMLIDGNGREASSKQWVESEYPFTRKVWARVPRGGADDAADAVSAASRALEAPSWGGLSPSARGKLLHRLADLFEAKAEEFARLEVMDNGKRITEMLGQMRRILIGTDTLRAWRTRLKARSCPTRTKPSST